MGISNCRLITTHYVIKEDTFEYKSDIPPGGHQDEEEIHKIDSEIEKYKPCHLCSHDNSKDSTCIYCNEEHRCWSKKA